MGIWLAWAFVHIFSHIFFSAVLGSFGKNFTNLSGLCWYVEYLDGMLHIRDLHFKKKEKKRETKLRRESLEFDINLIYVVHIQRAMLRHT